MRVAYWLRHDWRVVVGCMFVEKRPLTKMVWLLAWTVLVLDSFVAAAAVLPNDENTQLQVSASLIISLHFKIFLTVF